MPNDLQPRCPDCTYLLTALTEARCPECGLRFDARLLSEPSLALPRPTWERRPRVSFPSAIWRTIVDVTFRPRRFFAGIQQPDRLRRAVYWPALMVLVAYVMGVTYLFTTHRITGFASPTMGMSGLAYWRTALAGGAVTLFWSFVLVFFPLGVLLLVADLLLWRDRARYRLFFRGAMYSLAVYLWLVLVACVVGTILKLAGHIAGRPPFVPGDTWCWTNWLLASVMTWQYALIYYAVLDRRFAGLMPARPKCKAILTLLVLGAWLGGMYLTLLDRHIGLRFVAATWSWELLI
jgi:hypothetical protein